MATTLASFAVFNADIHLDGPIHIRWGTTTTRETLQVASHAAASPELGVNALDAMLTLFNGVNAFRQQMPEHCRIHGIITEGGVATNIIPDKAACRFLLRSATEEWIEKLSKRFLEIVQGASLIAGTTYTVEDRSTGCKSRKPNRYLNASYVEVMTELGEKVPANPPP